MHSYELRIENLSELDEIAKEFIKLIGDKKHFSFYGEMGAGKTTFISAVIKQFGVEDHLSSPTFSIINEYYSVNYGTIYHFDFYRIKDEIEAYDVGVEEIFEEDAYSFIEWPEKIENLIPSSFVSVNIKEDSNTTKMKHKTITKTK